MSKLRCMAGLYATPEGQLSFQVVRLPEAGYAIWEASDSEVTPDEYAQADGHAYIMIWSDERVEFLLKEETVRLSLLLTPILAPNSFILLSADPIFYGMREQIRERGYSISPNDLEEAVRVPKPEFTIGRW